MAKIETGAEKIVEKINAASEEGMQKAKAAFEDMNAKTKTAMEKGSKLMTDLQELAKGNLEAIVESGKIAAKGGETLAKDAAEFGKQSFESATAAFKSLASAKTPAELMQLQSNFAKTALESNIKEATKGSEKLIKYFGDVIAPLSNRASVNIEKFKSAVSL